MHQSLFLENDKYSFRRMMKKEKHQRQNINLKSNVHMNELYIVIDNKLMF